MLLYYIRHGDPVYEPSGLTPLGIRQAEALAKRLARYGVDEIYASSSRRAMLTVIRFEGAGKVIPCVLQLSNDSHLYREGLPTKYNNGISF